MEDVGKYDIFNSDDEPSNEEKSKEETPIELLASCFGLRKSPLPETQRENLSSTSPTKENHEQPSTNSDSSDFSNFKIQIDQTSANRKLSDESKDEPTLPDTTRRILLLSK